MSKKMAWFFIVCALIVVFAGLGSIGNGSWFGWAFVAIGTLNTVIGFVLLRKAARPLS